MHPGFVSKCFVYKWWVGDKPTFRKIVLKIKKKKENSFARFFLLEVDLQVTPCAKPQTTQFCEVYAKTARSMFHYYSPPLWWIIVLYTKNYFHVKGATKSIHPFKTLEGMVIEVTSFCYKSDMSRVSTPCSEARGNQICLMHRGSRCSTETLSS